MRGQWAALDRLGFASARAAAVNVIKFAARNYVAGATVADAGALAGEAAQSGYLCTICYWNDGTERPEDVASRYNEIIDFLAPRSFDAWLAMKLPALDDRFDIAGEIIAKARLAGVRVLIDSHAPEQADSVFRLVDLVGAEGIGCAIPGRWRRSVSDVERAIERGLAVRVVKGQWADPDEPGRDLRSGFLEIIDRLAGRAVHVGVATHDAPLAEEVLRRLQAAGTPCEQELLYPDPVANAVRVAEKAGVATRLYIPFGDAWLPYSVSKAVRNPKVIVWLARDVLGTRRFKMPKRLSPANTDRKDMSI